MYVSGILFNFVKVFDCMDHDVLLMKLNIYGVQGEAGQSFKSYLNSRVIIGPPDSSYNTYSK